MIVNQHSISRVRSTGTSPGNCNGCGDRIVAADDYVKISPRSDGASYLSGRSFHNVEHAQYRVEQEILTRRGRREGIDLKRLLDEMSG